MSEDELIKKLYIAKWIDLESCLDANAEEKLAHNRAIDTAIHLVRQHKAMQRVDAVMRVRYAINDPFGKAVQSINESGDCDLTEIAEAAVAAMGGV